jgi:hypothetical protein
MTKPLPPGTLAWLRQSATVDGSAYSQVLLHLLDRVEALEQRPIPGTVELAAPTPEADAAYAAIVNRRNFNKALVLKAQIRDVYDLGRQHGAAQPLAAQPAQPGQPPRHAESHHTQSPMPAVTKPLQATSNWKPQAQTEEQVAEGLRDAFRQAVREGVVTPQSDQRRGS